MTLVTVDDSMIYGWIYATIAVITILIILMIIWAITKVRTPKASNTLTSAHHRKVPLILLAGLDHFADLFPLKDFIPEVLQTNPFGRGVKKRQYRFILPQKTNVPELDVEGDKDPVITQKVIQALNGLNTDKVYIRGINTPLFVGVKNRAIAASLPFLGALNWLKDLEQIAKTPEAISALQKSSNNKFRDLGDLLSRMSTGISMVDFHAIYKYMDINWDHTVADSISERDKTDGRLEGREDKDKQTKTMLCLVALCLGLGVIIVVAASVLK